MIEGEIFIAWNSEGYAFGECDVSAAEALHVETDSSLPFRVARFEIQLPRPQVEEAGCLTVSGERPKLRIVE